MCRSCKSQSHVCCLAAAMVVVSQLASSSAPISAGEPASSGMPYHADPQHLWNRLHEAIFVRVGPDGNAYGGDRLDPLLWHETAHLLQGHSNDRAVALLQEFIDGRGEKLIDDPTKRAVLQRDLWLVFNWIERIGNDDRLRRRMAAAIRRLALTREQIQALPDNYAAAVASGEFATSYDPDRPDDSYLPPDLFAPDGPWVCVGRPDGPVAPQHLNDSGSNPSTNSVFLVFIRLPAGRGATLDFLKKLRSFDEPLLVKSDDTGNRVRKFLPNRNLPPIPAGTEMALVRRALLIDSSHTPAPSTLTESVQFRVYREVPEITAQSLDVSLVSGTSANQKAWLGQNSYEFRLSRPLLFAGRAGGLRAVGADERDFKTGFRAHGWDPFERREPGRRFPDAAQLPVRQNCFSCHRLPGIMSFNSYSENWDGGLVSGEMRRPAALSDVSVAEAVKSGIEWKENRPDWAALRKLLAD